MSASLLLSWWDGVSVEEAGDDGIRVAGDRGRVALNGLDPAIIAAMRRLAPPGDREDRLADSVAACGGPVALAGWYYWLGRLASRGLVARHVDADDARLATLLPTSGAFGPGAPEPPRGACRLSRFAYLRRDGTDLILDSPRAPARIVLRDPRAATLIAALSTAGTAEDLAGRVVGLPVEATAPLLTLLDGAGMIVELGPDGTDPEDEDLALAAWEFHDLLFHARTRKGHPDAPYGGTYRLADRFQPPPALAPDRPGASYPLERPDLERLGRDDPSLTTVLERRRSIRAYDEPPIDARQLGEFLYRVARVRDHREIDLDTPRGPVRLEVASRPFPSGGGLYELEFDLAIARCAGVEPGLYHYDPRHHQLVALAGMTADVDRLLRDAAASAGIPRETLQVLVILSSRFPRIAWKYASIAYALTLKHVGVVYQTMYLAATAMGLAPCALGGGDSTVFARAAGLVDGGEASVGEFLLGSRGSRD